MNRVLSNIIAVLIIVIGVVFIQYKYFPNTIVETTTETRIDTVVKTEYSEPSIPDTTEVPVFPLYDTSKCDSLYKDMYMKYGTKLAYSDTIYNDSIVTVRLNETVSKNTIFDRSVEVTKRIPLVTKTVTITNTKYANSLYIGGIFSSKEITPSLMYSTRKYTILAGYNLTSNTPVIGVGINLNNILKW